MLLGGERRLEEAGSRALAGFYKSIKKGFKVFKIFARVMRACLITVIDVWNLQGNRIIIEIGNKKKFIMSMFV